MRILLTLIASMHLAFAEAKIAVMETAFGNRCSVESIRLAKESGYAGVQIHTGKLEKNDLMTISDPEIQKQFLAASKKHGVEIVSLCAGAMNRIDVTKPGTSRELGRAVMIHSMNACQKLGCKTLLFPFFGPSNFQQSDDKLGRSRGIFKRVTTLRRALRSHHRDRVAGHTRSGQATAQAHRESGLREDVLRHRQHGRKNEDIDQALKSFGHDGICEIHLKPKKGIHFGKNDGTDLKKLASTLDDIGYDGWLVFEQGGGVKQGQTELSKENLKGVKKLVELRKPAEKKAQ